MSPYLLRDSTGLPICRPMIGAVVVCVLAIGPRLLCGQQLQFGGDTIAESIEKLDPKVPRSEQITHRLTAATHYSLGRMRLHREDLPGALRSFQRSYRYDPSQVIVREIVPLASSLKRHAEAARYAILDVERGSDDAELLRKLGELLVEQGELERGRKLLEKSLAAARQIEERSPAVVLLQAEIGRLYLLTENFEQASQLLLPLAEALDEPARFGFAGESQKRLLADRDRLYGLVGESLFRVGKFEAAADMFRRAQAAKSNEAVLAYQLARIAVEQQQWEEAGKRLEQYFALQSAAAGTQAYELLERVVAADGRQPEEVRAELVQRLTQLREKDPQNSALAHFLADKLRAAGDMERAQELYVASLTVQPSAAAYSALSEIYRAKRDAGALFRLIGSGLEKAGSPEIFGAPWEELARDAALVDQLAAHGRSQISATPATGYSPYLGIALLAIDADKPALVEEYYELALARPQAPRARIHEQVGLALIIDDEHALAVKVFQKALAAQPPADKAAAYYYYLSGAQEMLQQTDSALASARKCAELAPDSARFQARPAWVLYHAERLAEAEQQYRAVLDKFDAVYDDAETREQMRQVRLILSNLCVLQDRVAEAEELLEQVLDEFPEDVSAHNDLGYLWADQGKNLGRALQMCRYAVDQEGENGAYRDSLGWAFYRVGDFDQAVRELEKAASLTPDGVILDHLGDAYLKAKQVSQAIDTWQRAAKAFREEQDAERASQAEAKIQQHKSE